MIGKEKEEEEKEKRENKNSQININVFDMANVGFIQEDIALNGIKLKPSTKKVKFALKRL